MGDKPIWEQIGSSFVQHYYQLFDADRTQLGAIYVSMHRKGDSSSRAKQPLLKNSLLPFQKIQHSITAQDHQPTPDSCILSMVVGQLKADDDQVLGFHQTFLLKNFQGAWVCTNEVFRLALHNV
uniref:Nuclear transport factor 2 n=1 Tax=Catharus ustulatus TaxID=91951 RepID=A0A8C3UNI6_CATUS